MVYALYFVQLLCFDGEILICKMKRYRKGVEMSKLQSLQGNKESQHNLERNKSVKNHRRYGVYILEFTSALMSIEPNSNPDKMMVDSDSRL